MGSHPISSQTWRNFLQSVGISEHEIKIGACFDIGSCEVRSPASNQARVNFLPSFLKNDVFPLLKKQGQKGFRISPYFTSNHREELLALDREGKPGSDLLFYFVNGDWKFIDLDRPYQGVDDKDLPALLVLSHPLLAKEPELLERAFFKTCPLETWSKLGLRGGSAEFQQYTYAFETQSLNALPLLSPLDPIRISGSPAIEIPWSDPFLQMSWVAFLKKMDIRLYPKDDGSLEFHRKAWPSKIMTLKKLEDKLRFEFFNPFGAPLENREYPISQRNKYQLHSEDSTIEVHGARIKVHGLDKAKSVADALAEMPKSMVGIILQGFEKSSFKPLQFTIARAEAARQLGLIAPDHVGGNYSIDKNHIWLTLESAANLDSTWHEMGHAFDQAVPNLSQAYHSFKLKRSFPNPSDLHDLIYEYLIPKNKIPENYLKRIQENFLTKYAALGDENYATEILASKGVATSKLEDKDLISPSENLAEVFRVYFSNASDPFAKRQKYELDLEKEPLLKLLGFYYLHRQYGAQHIGKIPASEIFFQKGFSEMGVPLVGDSETYIRQEQERLAQVKKKKADFEAQTQAYEKWLQSSKWPKQHAILYSQVISPLGPETPHYALGMALEWGGRRPTHRFQSPEAYLHHQKAYSDFLFFNAELQRQRGYFSLGLGMGLNFYAQTEGSYLPHIRFNFELDGILGKESIEPRFILIPSWPLSLGAKGGKVLGLGLYLGMGGYGHPQTSFASGVNLQVYLDSF